MIKCKEGKISNSSEKPNPTINSMMVKPTQIPVSSGRLFLTPKFTLTAFEYVE
jgi:hypothetical protein